MGNLNRFDIDKKPAADDLKGAKSFYGQDFAALKAEIFKNP